MDSLGRAFVIVTNVRRSLSSAHELVNTYVSVMTTARVVFVVLVDVLAIGGVVAPLVMSLTTLCVLYF